MIEHVAKSLGTEAIFTELFYLFYLMFMFIVVVALRSGGRVVEAVWLCR